MKSRFAGIASGVLLLSTATAFAQTAPSIADLMKLIEAQNRKIEALAQKVQDLESRPGAAGGTADTTVLKKNLMETNEALAETNKKVDKLDQRLVLGKGIDGVKFTGDLRVRYEARNTDIVAKDTAATKDGDRSRFRTRFRLGGVWTNKAEDWEVGAGLASGSADGRSTNDTWGDENGRVFETGDIRLDYAYAKHNWTLNDVPVTLTLGQQKNPFVATLLTWDGDLRPVGFTLQYGDPFGKEYCGPFATAGAYVVRWLSSGGVTNNLEQEKWNDSVNLYAAQIGYKYMSEPFDALGMAGLEVVSNAYRNSDVYANSSLPNNTIGKGDTGYEYQIGELYGEVKTAVSGVELKPYAHVAYNFGADGRKSQAVNNSGVLDTQNNNLGWLLGLDAKRGRWKLGYTYAYIGADAVFGPMKDSDFGETAGLQDTDVQGHLLKLSYNPLKNLELGAAYFLLDRINHVKATEPNSTQCVQLDAVYKF